MAWKTILPATALIFSLLIKGGLAQSFEVRPVNTAGKLGDGAQLNCTADLNGDYLEWREFTPGTGSGSRIFISPDGPVLDDNYEVEIGGDGEYNLIIKSSSYAMAGPYRCNILIADLSEEVQFVALSASDCSRWPTTTTFVEGQVVTMTCEVTYQGQIQPQLSWWSELGILPSFTQEEEDDEVVGRFTLRAIANLTVEGRHDDIDFRCEVTFSDNTHGPLLTIYSDECSTNFFVQHAANTVEISPDPDNFAGGVIPIHYGETINCSASGRPPPTYSWHEEDGGRIELGGNLLITNDMEGTHSYRCEAKNTIDGVPRTAQRTVTFHASATHRQPHRQLGIRVRQQNIPRG